MFMFCRLLWSRSIFPLRWDDRGATAVEYGLMVAFISAVIVGAVTALGIGVLGLFGKVPPGL